MKTQQLKVYETEMECMDCGHRVKGVIALETDLELNEVEGVCPECETPEMRLTYFQMSHEYVIVPKRG